MTKSKKRRRKRGGPITAEELVKQLESDPEWVARREKQEAKRLAWSRALFASEAPLVADLRRLGFDVESVWDLFNRKEPWRTDERLPAYPEAVPVLIEHFGRPYPFEVREGIVRALTDRYAREAFDRIVEEYRRTTDPEVAAEEQRRELELVLKEAGDLYEREELEKILAHRWDSYRFALANAIVYHFRKEHIPLLVELIRSTRTSNRSHWRALSGDIRRKVGLWRRKDPTAGEELLSLLASLQEERQEEKKA